MENETIITNKSDEAAQLIDEFRRCSEDWLRNLSRMSQIVRRLDELGVPVRIENSLLPYIRLIAHGQLSANLFITAGGDSQLLEKAMRLPLPTQERIALNEPMKVMEICGDHRMVPPLDMTSCEKRQVFKGKQLRTDAEQIGWLREKQAKITLNEASGNSDPDVMIDKKRRGITVRGRFISLSELVAFISALAK